MARMRSQLNPVNFLKTYRILRRSQDLSSFAQHLAIVEIDLNLIAIDAEGLTYLKSARTDSRLERSRLQRRTFKSRSVDLFWEIDA
jgi:hypothetical protein